MDLLLLLNEIKKRPVGPLALSRWPPESWKNQKKKTTRRPSHTARAAGGKKTRIINQTGAGDQSISHSLQKGDDRPGDKPFRHANNKGGGGGFLIRKKNTKRAESALLRASNRPFGG